jgi:hypothetical protein
VRPALLLVLLVVLTACSARLGSGGSESVEIGPDARTATESDAAPASGLDGSAVAANNACGVALVQGDLGSLSGEAGIDPQETGTDNIYYIQVETPLSASDPAPDVVLVELWDGFGGFTGGKVRTGTFPITGEDLDYDTCGICVLMLADVANNTPAKLMLATAGTVTITSVATAVGQKTQLSVADASFVEIEDVPNQGFEPVADSSCASPISNVVLADTI